MISTFRFLVVPLLAGSLVAAGCTSSGGGGLSEDEAAERVAAVVAAFDAVADEEGFGEDDEEDDDDDFDFECEAFEAFDQERADPIAKAESSVTDGGEPEVSDVGADGHVTFEGGEVSGGVEVSVIDESELDEAIDALDSIIDEPDEFAECTEAAFAEAFTQQQDDSFQLDDLELDVDVSGGSAGDQELRITVSGSLEISGDGFSAEFPLAGEVRFVRVGRAGMSADAFAVGEVTTDTLEPAIDAAVAELEAQFG